MKQRRDTIPLKMLAAGLLLLFISLPHGQSQSENVYYVKPTPDMQCQEQEKACHTLSEYAEMSFESSSTLAFLPGDHTLDTNFTIANVTTLIIRGDSANETRVTCTAPVTFLLENIVNVSITGLTLQSCGSKIYSNVLDYAAVTVRLVQWFELSKCVLAQNGGGLRVYESNLTFVDNTFESNSADLGSVAYIKMCTLTLSGNIFENNTAALQGGAIWAAESKLNFSDTNSFVNNVAAYEGGGIWALNSTLVFNGNNNFTENRVGNLGGGVWATNSKLSFNGNSVFMNNDCEYAGGGIIVITSQVHFIGDTIFIDNHANTAGAGIAVVISQVTFDATLLCRNNEVNINLPFSIGGCMYAIQSTVAFTGNNSFEANSAATSGGALWMALSNVTFYGESKFMGNMAGFTGGALSAFEANLYFSGKFSFLSNSANFGGALRLAGQMHFYVNTTIYFEDNIAQIRGGAINIIDSNPFAYCGGRRSRFINPQLTDCFFQIEQQNASDTDPSITLTFVNNTAVEGGNDVYGGSIDYCRLLTSPYLNDSGEVFDSLVVIKQEPTSISSDPLLLSFCDGTSSDPQVYPGGSFDISLLAVGQRQGPVSTLIQSDFQEPVKARFSDATMIQQINNTCTKLKYNVVLETADYEKVSQSVLLLTEGPFCAISLVLPVHITILPCPSGFDLSDTSGQCVCEERLKRYTENCNIDDMTIERSTNFWVSFDMESNGLILHPHCPFDYCKPDSETVAFTLNNTDEQCNYDRSGHLCGACKPGQSLVLGSSRCYKCTNNTLALLIPFTLAGFALVVLLLTCGLIVTSGTINGLIFYANIVAPNRAIFFPQGDTNILTVFIAWLNLDLGIEMCFFDGMDAYTRTWLQFVFPAYVWALVGAIILFSHYSTRFARLFGSNPVSVLATLFLLSYTKLLRTIITALSFTFLEYPNDSRVVWLYDGNISFLQGKHIPLFLVALLALVFLFIPYTLLLLLGQWIQAHSRIRVFSWISDYRLKSFLDAYHAPYKYKYRYWTGLLLLVRSILLLAFGLNVVGDPSVNLLVISMSTLGLSIWVWTTGSMYKKSTLNILEAFFILNLNFLAVATSYVNASGGSQAAVTYTSVSVSFATFIGILLYNAYLSLRGTKLWANILGPKLKVVVNYCRRTQREAVSGISMLSQSQSLPRGVRAPTSSSVELRESLLESHAIIYNTQN